jgi:hypothetical protein
MIALPEENDYMQNTENLLQTLSEKFNALQEAFADQQAEVAALRAQLEETKQNQTAATSREPKPKTSRRHLFTTAGAAAAAATVALVPHGAGFSGTAILSFSAGQVISNSFNVGLSGGKLDIIIGGNPTDVILDLFAVVA